MKLASPTNTCKYISYMLLHTVSESCCHFAICFYSLPCLWDSLLRHMNRTNEETRLTVPTNMTHTSKGRQTHKFLETKYNPLNECPNRWDINHRSLYQWTTMPYDSTPSVKLHIRAYGIILNVRTFRSKWFPLTRRVLDVISTSQEFCILRRVSVPQD